MKSTTPPSALPDGYANWLQHPKQDIAHARQRAALAVNTELVRLYGRIGPTGTIGQQPAAQLLCSPGVCCSKKSYK